MGLFLFPRLAFLLRTEDLVLDFCLECLRLVLLRLEITPDRTELLSGRPELLARGLQLILLSLWHVPS